MLAYLFFIVLLFTINFCVFRIAIVSCSIFSISTSRATRVASVGILRVLATV